MDVAKAGLWKVTFHFSIRFHSQLTTGQSIIIWLVFSPTALAPIRLAKVACRGSDMLSTNVIQDQSSSIIRTVVRIFECWDWRPNFLVADRTRCWFLKGTRGCCKDTVERSEVVLYSSCQWLRWKNKEIMIFLLSHHILHISGTLNPKPDEAATHE